MPLLQLEVRAGGPTATAHLLGVPYTSSYCRWKRGEALPPRYIRRSIDAYLALSDRKLNEMLKMCND